MVLSKKNILITGQPGIGKTTVIKKLCDELKNLHPAGFYTVEIRKEGIRKGFELIGLYGRKGILAHTDIKSPHRVGKYGIDIRGFEDFLETIPFLYTDTSTIIIDEIGKMECFSTKFKNLINEIMDSDKLIIATISIKGRGIIEEIKKRDDIKLFELTQSNRDTFLSEILNYVKEYFS